MATRDANRCGDWRYCEEIAIVSLLAQEKTPGSRRSLLRGLSGGIEIRIGDRGVMSWNTGAEQIIMKGKQKHSSFTPRRFLSTHFELLVLTTRKRQITRFFIGNLRSSVLLSRRIPGI